MRVWIAICWGVFLSNWICAQQFHLKSYSLEEGLPRVGVYDIFQDHNGFIWVGTEGGGICKFDGHTFHSYTRRNGLPSDNIRLIFEDDQNTLWLATNKGICYFDGYQFNKVPLSDSLNEDRIRAFSQDAEGRIWVGTDHGISFIDAKNKSEDSEFQLDQIFPDSTIRSLMWHQNKMWIASDSGLYLYSGGGLKLFENQAQLSSYQIIKLYADSKGAVWIGTSAGVNKISGDDISFWTTADGLVHNRVRSIQEDCYGNMWFGTFSGINIFDGEQMIAITSENGLTNERVRCITRDNFDNIWIGTFYGGMMRYNYKDFTGFTVHEGLASNQIQAIHEDEYGDILVGTSAGLTHLEVIDNKLYNYATLTLGDSYLGNSIRAVYYDQNGYTWLGNARGITVIKGDYRKEILFQSHDAGVDGIGVNVIKFYNNKFFIGTTHGLFQVNVIGDYESFQTVNLSLNNKMGGWDVSSIICDAENRIWVGFADGTISVYDKARIVTPVVSEELFKVISIASDSSDNIWIGTDGNGLFRARYNSETKQLDLFGFSKLNGLTSDYIYSILYVKDKLWIGHERGVDIAKIEADTISSVIVCGSEIGFTGLQNYQNASLFDSKGNLWFGTVNGLFRLNGKELETFLEGANSIIHLTGIKVNGSTIDWEKSGWADSTAGIFKLPVNLELPYSQNNLEFKFVAINYVAPDKIRYSWKLDGFDHNWSDPSKDNHILYTNLEPGNYTFRLRASNELGVIQEEEYSFSFIIHKPFWQTWWFRIVMTLAALFLGVAIMRWRTRQLREKQKKLELIIEERTAEISSQNEMLEEKNKEITDSIFYSRRIQRSVLPAKEKVAKLLSDYFIFFRPKDIVSGDFYWAERSLDKQKIFFAVADCTGHGVPGAMVSLIATRALNSALREHGIDVASEILDSVNVSMIESFTEAETGNVIKDGMDISLCSIEYEKKDTIRFQYAGAQNSVWIVRAEQEKKLEVNGIFIEPNMTSIGYNLFEIKADKQPIGYFEGRINFKNNTATLKKGDRIYLYSDGFADQFGGEKGKKFKYKTLKELILSCQDQSMNQQYGIIRNTFYDWKREFEQLDDVCMMGVEV
jgi:ligand-binding sensor domain-containing protein/serine phosphatase RsbU (regulator of sigma subunit)